MGLIVGSHLVFLADLILCSGEALFVRLILLICCLTYMATNVCMTLLFMPRRIFPAQSIL